MKSNKGFTLIEVIISVMLVIFLLFAVFYAIGNVLSLGFQIEVQQI